MATKKYNEKKQKLFKYQSKTKAFFCFCWDDNTLTAAHNDKCDEQNAHVEKIQRNNNEISRPDEYQQSSKGASSYHYVTQRYNNIRSNETGTTSSQGITDLEEDPKLPYCDF